MRQSARNRRASEDAPVPRGDCSGRGLPGGRQGPVTSEISGNVQQAAEGMQDVPATIAGVIQAVERRRNGGGSFVAGLIGTGRPAQESGFWLFGGQRQRVACRNAKSILEKFPHDPQAVYHRLTIGHTMT